MKAFVLAAGERAVGVFSGVLSSVLVADGVDVFHVGWKAALGTSLGAALLSVLASLAKRRVGPEGPGLMETTAGAGRRRRAE